MRPKRWELVKISGKDSGVRNGSMEERGEAKVGKVCKDDGDGGRDVMPKPRRLEDEEQNARDNDEDPSSNVDRPLPSVLPSASEEEHGIALKVLIIALLAVLVLYCGALGLGS